MDQIAQGDPRLHLAFEANQHRFRHIQRHDAGRGGKGHQTRTCREEIPPGSGMRVTTGTDGIRQQRFSRVDNAIARRRETPPRFIMKSARMVRGDVNRLRIGRGGRRTASPDRRRNQGTPGLSVHHGSSDRWYPGTDGGHLRFTVSAGRTPASRRRGQPFSAPASSRGCFSATSFA